MIDSHMNGVVTEAEQKPHIGPTARIPTNKVYLATSASK